MTKSVSEINKIVEKSREKFFERKDLFECGDATLSELTESRLEYFQSLLEEAMSVGIVPTGTFVSSVLFLSEQWDALNKIGVDIVLNKRQSQYVSEMENLGWQIR